MISALLSASIALVVMVGMLIYHANTSRRPPHMHKKRAHFLFHALPGSPTKGLCGYMKRKCAHTGAPSLTCRPQFNIGRISRERLVSKMLICLCQLRLGGGGRGATARMLAHPSGSAFAESALRNAFAFLRRIYRFGGGFIETALPFGRDKRGRSRCV